MSDTTHHHMDPTFYRSPSEAIAAPTEQLAYVAAVDRAAQTPDAPTVVDTDPSAAPHRPRHPPGAADLGADRGLARSADGRPRTAPLRLERLLQRPQARGPRHGP